MDQDNNPIAQKGALKMATFVKDENILRSKRFPRSNEYDPQWIISNQMGLNPLWLTEWLCEKIHLTAGMRVLDLGCGKGLAGIIVVGIVWLGVWAWTQGRRK